MSKPDKLAARKALIIESLSSALFPADNTIEDPIEYIEEACNMGLSAISESLLHVGNGNSEIEPQYIVNIAYTLEFFLRCQSAVHSANDTN